MKTVLLTAVALLASAGSSPRTEGQVAPDLQPTLKILQVVSTPMPDFHGVPFYPGLPDGQGNTARGTGHSDFVRGWLSQMEPAAPKFTALGDRLRLDVDVYGDTVKEEGQAVLDASADLKKQLNDLDTVTLGKVKQLIEEWRREVAAVRRARKELDAARNDATAAKFEVEGSDAGAKECNLLLQRSKAEAKRAALLTEMQKGSAFLDAVEKAIAAMATGPEGVAAYVTAEATRIGSESAKQAILEIMYSGTRDALYDLAAQIEAIDRSLADVKCQQQNASLKAAKARLQARLIGVVVAFGDVLDHGARAWGVVDQLGTLRNPQNRQTSRFLTALQAYNAQVNTMGHKVFRSLDAYLDYLRREPLSRGELVLGFIDEDKGKVARDRSDPSGTWNNRVDETRAYLFRYQKWYDGEVARGQIILADLVEGKQFDFVDRMMARASRELGFTVNADEIIR